MSLHPLVLPNLCDLPEPPTPSPTPSLPSWKNSVKPELRKWSETSPEVSPEDLWTTSRPLSLIWAVRLSAFFQTLTILDDHSRCAMDTQNSSPTHTPPSPHQSFSSLPELAVLEPLAINRRERAGGGQGGQGRGHWRKPALFTGLRQGPR